MVKYADGPTTEVSVVIDASPDRVWPVVSDINTPAAFSDEFVGAEWIDAGPSMGATFRGHNRRDDFGDWEVLCTVTACEPDSVFEWTVGDLDDKVSKWRFDIAADGATSRLRFSAEMGPGRSGLTPAIERMPDREDDIVARRLEQWTANMQRTVDGIKSIVEGATS